MSSRNLISIFVIAAVVTVTGYFIISNSSVGLQNQSNGISDNLAAKPLVENPFQLTNNSDSLKNFGTDEGVKILKNSGDNKIDFNSANLTQLSAQSLFQGIKILNNSGNNPFSNANNPETQKIMEKSINDISSLNFYLPLKDNLVKTSADNSKTSKQNYLKLLKKIFDDEVVSVPLDKINNINTVEIDADCSGQSNLSFNRQRAEFFGDIYNKYLQIAAPSDWKNFHKQILDFYSKTRLVFISIANCFSDPIKANLMMEQSYAVFGEDAFAIQKSEKEKYAEVGLTYK